MRGVMGRHVAQLNKWFKLNLSWIPLFSTSSNTTSTASAIASLKHTS